MSHRSRRQRAAGARLGVRPGALLAALALMALALALWATGGARGAQLGGGLVVSPQLSAAFGATLLGSAPQGTASDPSETWAIQFIQGSRASPPVIDGTPLAFGPGTGGQVALLRYTGATGWRFAQTPVDEDGAPYRGGQPNLDSGRVTPRGGILVAANDSSRAGFAAKRVLMVADRGGALRVLPTPPRPQVLDPDVAQPTELLSLDVLAAVDDGDRTRAYVSIEGRDRQRGIAAWNGQAWSREPICVAESDGTPPADCSAGESLTGSSALFGVVALAATGERAWMLARPADATGRGITLFERRQDGGTVRWVLRSLGRAALEQSSTPAVGVTAMAALPTGRALTATPDGVWVDGRFELRGTPADVTAFFDGARVTAWCDADAFCEHPLGLRFSERADGHRSFAWAGQGVGSRVIAPIPSGAESEAFATLEGTTFVRRETFNPRRRRGAAFGAADEGWVGLSHINRQGDPITRASWPIPVRKPLTAISGSPERPPGDIAAQALAVGSDGTVLRYTPGQGWDSEQLLGASGVALDDLTGVAWPTPGFSFAVGDRGAMWRWDRATGLWEPDPGAPFDFQGDLTGVAFQPGNPDRGYAVGRGGVLLRYDKSWTPEALPAELQRGGPLDGPEDLTDIAFAGSEAIVAAGNAVLVNDGSGWRVDAGAEALLGQVDGSIYAVAGLADGGAVAAGLNVVLVRDGPGSAWRFSDQPLPDQVVTAVGAFREDGQVRAVVAVSPQATSWPRTEDVELVPADPGSPPPLPPPFSLPSDGTVLRQTAAGWRDEERAVERSPTADAALKVDPTNAMLLDASGRGWLVGGWNGRPDFVSRAGPRAQTASVTRYAQADPEPAPGLRASSIETPAGPLRLLVGGHAQCESACAAQAALRLMPDQTLAGAARQAAVLGGQPNGPRALLYTGGRVPPDASDAAQPQPEADRLAALLGGAVGMSVYAAAAPGDETGGTAGAFQRAFADAPAPFGTAPAVAGATPVELGAAPDSGLARTHYAVDVAQGSGRVRVIVIDNAAGSLSASDPMQNPREPQRAWLEQVLDNARAGAIPAVVMGNRSLNPQDGARAAADAAQVATLLRDHGASAYLYDSPERQIASTIPAGEAGIPSFGSGTLGYRVDDDAFGVPALLMLELDTARRDSATNRVPVATRLIPVVEDLALEAIDGRVLNRSRPALFRALGRRPRSGDRSSTNTSGSDPYVALPNPSCAGTGCAGRLEPEVRFVSSQPDIADFVRQDPASTNPRKPFVDPATDKPVPDAASGLLCAFNAGTTTVSVAAGGLTYTTTLTVRGGSVLRPCGTVPLSPRNLPAQQATAPVAPAPAPSQPQPAQPAAEVTLPAPVPAPPAATPAAAAPPPPAPFVPPGSNAQAVVGTIVPPPGLSPRPIPPSGTSPVSSPTSVVQPATRVEKEREEELAPEQQQSAVRYVHGSGNAIPPGAVLALLLAAGMLGAGLRPRTQGRDRGEELAMSYAPPARRRL